ncbi:MAG: WbqC family protein [Chloroflexota bacterium]|jgi:hypothetical protein|nr:WbqC family protein [Chloroflexota bacterium]
MKVAIHQPNYLPWRGYFAKMRLCDKFVFLDDAEIPQGRNFCYRVEIRGHQQDAMWLSVPVNRQTHDLIKDVYISYSEDWVKKHLNSLKTIYSKCKYFDEVFHIVEPVYKRHFDKLSDLNIELIKLIANYMGINCQFYRSSELAPVGVSDDRLISIATMLDACIYISGKGGQKYQNPQKFLDNKIKLMVYEYPIWEYKQIHGDFIQKLSIIDALFHLGKDTINLLPLFISESGQ